MLTRRNSAERGHADHGWLKSAHSFSFASYYHPAHMGFGPLRVINEDRVVPGAGFGTHGHRDMEIISYVLTGGLAHRDSMGNGSTIQPGDVQLMSAGTGVQHSEYNASVNDPVHFLQIWIEPSSKGKPSRYAEKHFPAEEKRGRLRLLVSQDGADGSLSMLQYARLYAGLFDGAEQASLALASGRRGYVFLARGQLLVNGERLQAGDALQLQDETLIALSEGQDAEVLVFDLP